MSIAKWAAITVLSLSCGLALIIGLTLGSCNDVKSDNYTVKTPLGSITAPAGATIKFASTQPGIKESKDVRTGEASAGSASGTKAKVDGKLADLDLAQFSSVGGASKATAEYIGPRGGVLIAFGVLFIAAAIAIFWFTKNIVLSGCCVAAGILLIAMGVWPEFALVLGVILLGIIGFFVYRAVQASQTAKAATAMSQGIEAGMTIGPADLPLTISPEQYPFATAVIEATVKVIKSRTTSISEKMGGSVASFLKTK